MKTISVVIAQRGGDVRKDIPVKAYEGGLAIHRPTSTFGETSGTGWAITHVHSGLLIIETDKLPRAKAFVKAILPLAQWDGEIKPSADLVKAVREKQIEVGA